MNTINVKVNFTKGTCEVSGINLISGDYNSTKMVFTFDRDDGTKIFEMKSPSEELVMLQEIQNNEIILYGLDDNEQIASIFTEDGNYIFEISLYENGSKLTSASGKLKVKPEQVVIDGKVVEAYIPVFDQLLNDITTTVQGLEDDVDDKLDEVDTKLGQVDSKMDDVDDKIDEVDAKLLQVDVKIGTIEGQIEATQEIVDQANNLDLDVSKSGKTTTVTITKKDETTESENILDGKNLEFVWSGTSLGVRVEGDSQYTYVNLQGVQGPIGPQGEPFKIKKTYSSIAEMNADFNNMEIGDYVMIANSVETEDNAKLYTKTAQAWVFITDFSGATGIQGPTGATPSISIGTVSSGTTPSVTRTGTDENPVLNFVLQKGDKGDTGNTGDTGATGNGISSIEKTSETSSQTDYRINYTNGEHFDYSVENGEVTQSQLDEVIAENDYLNSIINQIVPKVTGSGEYITLNDTIEAKMDIDLYASELTQDGTPSPSSPQDIHTISGSNKLLIENKNLLKANNIEFTPGAINWYGLNGVVLNNPSQLTDTSIGVPVKANKTYTFSIHSQTNANRFQLVYISGTSFAAFGSITTGTPITFTPTADTIVYPRVEPTSASAKLTCELMIEENSTATNYEPYILQEANIDLGDIEYCKIGEHKDKFMKPSGANLMRLGTQSNGYRSIDTGLFQYHGSAIGYYFKTSQLPNTITFTGIGSNRSNVSYYNDIPVNGATSLDYSNSSTTPRTITVNKNYTYIHIQFSYGGDVTDIMVNEGSTALPYEPYGTGWYLKKNIGKVDLGTLSYSKVTNATYGDYFKTSDITNAVKQQTYYSTSFNALCNSYRVAGRNVSEFLDNTFVFDGTSTAVAEIQFKNSNYSDATTFKNSLSGVYLYYPILTQYLPITGTLANQLDNIKSKLLSQKGQTNISQVNNDLPFEISVSALGELNV